jgi:DNA-directed RNA polymerase subunit RPC12/RpoP
MTFIGKMEGQEIQVELKYCERCGKLWLRPQGADGVHCASCRVLLAAMPDPGEAPPPQSAAPQGARARSGRSKRRPSEPGPD